MTTEFRPPAPQAIMIAGPAGDLEARVEEPVSNVSQHVVGVVCHPHPLFGGTMQNKVVHTLARAMQELGCPTVRFNFRGVGASAGVHDDGNGEVDDALAVIAWARTHWQCEALWLAGFSFGAAVAINASTTAAPVALVAVAPPVRRLTLDPDVRPACPWLIVQGDSDELVAVADVEEWSQSLLPRPHLVTLKGAEHFFHGRLSELRDSVIGFLRQTSE